SLIRDRGEVARPCTHKRDVCLGSDSGAEADIGKPPLWANSGHYRSGGAVRECRPPVLSITALGIVVFPRRTSSGSSETTRSASHPELERFSSLAHAPSRASDHCDLLEKTKYRIVRR